MDFKEKQKMTKIINISKFQKTNKKTKIPKNKPKDNIDLYNGKLAKQEIDYTVDEFTAMLDHFTLEKKMHPVNISFAVLHTMFDYVFESAPNREEAVKLIQYILESSKNTYLD